MKTHHEYRLQGYYYIKCYIRNETIGSNQKHIFCPICGEELKEEENKK